MMKDALVIRGLGGKKKLKGEISVAGAKNAVLPALASALLFEDDVTIANIPAISDVVQLKDILADLGCDIKEVSKRKYRINTKKVKETTLDMDLAKHLRASIVLLGPLLGRFGTVVFPHPGGCVIGPRPIDLFLEGFVKMGCSIKMDEKQYSITRSRKKRLKGADIFFKVVSVTATETFMMAAVLAEGKTVLRNAATEPEVEDLARFLNASGAHIKGAGTSIIEITGRKALLRARGKTYTTMPDRIEAGSFLILGALAADDLKITHCNPEHIEILIEILRESGVPIRVENNTIVIRNNRAIKNRQFRSANIRTHEYPGFATDLQAPMTVFLTQASGEAVVFETIFEGRLYYAEDLAKMGADITMWDPHRIMVRGPRSLRGRVLEGPDLRAGLAYIIAAAVAKGESVINNVYYIDRGYENIEGRLSALGLPIKRIPG